MSMIQLVLAEDERSPANMRSLGKKRIGDNEGGMPIDETFDRNICVCLCSVYSCREFLQYPVLYT